MESLRPGTQPKPMITVVASHPRLQPYALANLTSISLSSKLFTNYFTASFTIPSTSRSQIQRLRHSSSSFCVRRERVVTEVKDGPAIQAIVQRKQPAGLDDGRGSGIVVGNECWGIRRDVEALVRPWGRIMPEFQI